MRHDFKEKEQIFSTKSYHDEDPRLVAFKDVLCVYFDKSKELLRFKENKQLLSLNIPDQVGRVHTINASGILLISGNKGYAIYDE